MSGSLCGALQDLSTVADSSGRPPRRRRLWLLGIGAVVLVVALVVFASQQGNKGGSGGPLNAIAQAAVKTQREGGGRAAVRGTISTPERSKPLILTGRVVYADSGLGRGYMATTDLKTGKPVKIELVQDGTQAYMRSSSFGTLPDGKEWMGIDYSLGDELDVSAPTNGDVTGELALLELASGDVEKLGKEKVRGVSTTRYRASISVAENAKRLREMGGQEAAELIEKEGAPLQVEAWIDAKELVRRMRLILSKPGEEVEGPITTDITIDFFDFGFEPEIDVPDSDEVFDTTSLVQERLDDSNGD
jgi:hypothetical protein